MGEVTEIVNAGVSVIKLVANHAGSATQDGQFANALPPGVDAASLSGWHAKSPKPARQWKQRSDWYEFWNVDWEFTVGMKWMYDGTDGEHKFVDQATITLDVEHIPPDFTLDVTARFPRNGLMGSGGVAVLGFTMEVLAKGMLGQVVAWQQNFDCEVYGDGNYTWNRG